MRTLSRSFAALALAVPLGLGACTDDAEPPCEGSGVICTFMGTGRAGLGVDGVPPEEVLLYLPQDVAEDPEGQIYVLDWNNHRVRTVVDGRVETLLGTGYLGDAPEGYAEEISLNHPTHISFDPTGRLYLSAWHNSKVMVMNRATGWVENLCGTGGRSYAGDGGPALEAVLDLPVATVIDSRGRAVIMDQANQRIRRIELDGTIDTIVGPPRDYVHVPAGFVEACFDDGAGGQTCKVCPEAEAADPECEGVAFKPQGFAGDGGPATEAFLFLPFSQSAAPAGRIDIDADDRIYIADTGNQRVRLVDTDGTIRTVAGSGPETFDPTFTGGYAGDGGPATEALLRTPSDVAVAPDGSFYIADRDNHCVRKVDTAGVITTAAGVCGQRGRTGDGGPATEALLDRPYGIFVSSDGTLYIADTHNHRIRVVYP